MSTVARDGNFEILLLRLQSGFYWCPFSLQFNRKDGEEETALRSLKSRREYIKTECVDWSWTGSWCGPLAGSYNMAGTNELSGSAKGKELLESVSDCQFQLKDSMQFDVILRVELSVLVLCLWELVSRCHGREFWYLGIALLQSAVNKFFCFKQDVRFMIYTISISSQRYKFCSLCGQLPHR